MSKRNPEKRRLWSRLMAVAIVFCFTFTAFPVLGSEGYASAASAQIKNLKVTQSGSSVTLKWKKLSAKQQKKVNGVAVFRDGEVIRRLGKKSTGFTDSASGAHTYQVKAYKKTTKTQWYNKKTGKWQTKKPAKKNRGKSKKVASYSYKYSSATVRADISDDDDEEVYTITWKNWDGSVLKKESYKYGEMPSYKGSTPVRQSDEFYNYTFKGWKPELEKVTGNKEYKTKFKATPINQDPAQPEDEPYVSQYSYDIKFVNEPYGNGGDVVLYIETNHPADYSWSVAILDENGNNIEPNHYSVPGNISEFINLGRYEDLKNISYDTAGKFFAVINTFGNSTYSGNSTIAIYEDDPDPYKTHHLVATKDFYLKDYNKEKNEWMQSVIDEVTNDTMTNKDKMVAICGYILGNFDYTKNNLLEDGSRPYLYFFTDEGLPYWIDRHINSYSSPAILVEFGKKLGYPLENLYGKYPYGSDLWMVYHLYAYSAEDDYYFEACPPSDTGVVDMSNIKTFDPSTYQFWE